jgi:phenylpropionate dioxygenase-like ring-hydroxylating dioxygenase large terminal subunit
MAETNRLDAPYDLRSWWHPVARSDEIDENPKQFTLLGESLVLFRMSGSISAFKDLCIHRGAALSLGRIRDGALTCAYHGWQYDRTGACIRIPSRPDIPIPHKAKAITFNAADQFGLAWVALQNPAAPIPSSPLGEFNDPTWRSFLSYDNVWETSAGRAVENFMDFSHFPFVHEDLLGTPDKAEVIPYEVTENDDGMRYVREERLSSPQGVSPILHQYVVELPFTVHIRKPESGGGTTIKSLFACPTSTKKCRVWVWITRDHSLEEPDAGFGDFTNMIMEQDRVVVESQRPEEIPLDMREELHLKVPDAASLLYRKQLAKFGIDEVLMP